MGSGRAPDISLYTISRDADGHLCLEEIGHHQIQDVCGHKFGVYIQSSTYNQAKAMLKAANVSCTLEEVPVTIPGTREFMSGSVDMIHTFSFNEPVFRMQNFDVVHFDVSDYYHLYSMVIARRRKVDEARRSGAEVHAREPEGAAGQSKGSNEALAALGRANKDLKLELEAPKMPMLLELMTVPGDGGRKLPQQTAAGWNETIDNLIKLGVIKKKVDPTGRFVSAEQ